MGIFSVVDVAELQVFSAIALFVGNRITQDTVLTL